MNTICNWSFQQSQKTQMMNRNIAFFCRFCSSQQVNSVTDSIWNYSNSGFDLSSYLKTDSTNEFSSSCTTRIVPILTTGVSFLRSYKVPNKRPIMGHPRSDSGWTGYVSVQSKYDWASLGLTQTILGRD